MSTLHITNGGTTATSNYHYYFRFRFIFSRITPGGAPKENLCELLYRGFLQPDGFPVDKPTVSEH